jgi:DNA-binding response OmpR family regulator
MRVLIVEDDKELCEVLNFELKNEGFTVDICHDGYDGLEFIKQQAHDIILLDQMLPSIHGIEIVKIMRREWISTPVILVTALGELNDKINGLDSGADDYIVKPFEFGELLARIRSINRRPRNISSTELVYGDLTFNIDEKVLKSNALSCSLSKKEGDLMELFLKNPDIILPRMTLLTRVWGPYSEIEEGNIDNYIHFLRKRLAFLKSKTMIKTLRGVGYRLEGKDV